MLDEWIAVTEAGACSDRNGQDGLEQALGYRFQDSTLLPIALTHRSHSSRNNERLEFLGDSVLNCIITDELYRRFPELAEGDLSRVRAVMVRQQTLFERAHALDIVEHLLLGKAKFEAAASNGLQFCRCPGSNHRRSICRWGFRPLRVVCSEYSNLTLRDADPVVLGKDPKTLLQEFLQAAHRFATLPIVATQGEAHRQRFCVECSIAQLAIKTLARV